MFKAAVALVAFAFATLAYGWVKGIDPLLYGSIGLSAVAGLFVRVVMVKDRKAHPELTRKGRKAALEPVSVREAQRERQRKSLAELRMELGQISDEARTAYGAPRRAPLNPFADPARTSSVTPAVESDLLERPLQPAARPRVARNGELSDFRSRLSAVLGEVDSATPVRPAPPVADIDDEIGNDWIRIDDVPRIARATQEGGGYGRPDPQPAGRGRSPRPASGRVVVRPKKSDGGSSAGPARNRSKG